MTRVSVILSVYNEEEAYLREAIESILNQTYKDFEFIIVNDGSTNNVEEVILSYHDNRIVYLKNETNMNVIYSRNRALEISKGEYIVHMDSDDVTKIDRIQLQVDFMDKHPSIAACGSQGYSIPPTTKYTCPTDSYKTRVCNRYVSNCMLHSALIVRKSVMIENNIKYDKEYLYSEDYKFYIDLNKYGEITNLPDILLLRRLHPQSASFQHRNIQVRNSLRILIQNCIEDFGEDKTSILQNILDRFMSEQNLTFKEFCTIDAFIYKSVQKIFDIVDESEHKYIKSIYTDIRQRFISATKPSKALLFMTLYSRTNKLLQISKLYKYKSLNETISRIIQEEIEKQKAPHVFG